MSTEKIQKVLSNQPQGLTEQEQAQARANIGVDLSTLATKAELAGKQDVLTAGDNVHITNNVISATDTTYSAGSGLNLNGTEFSVDTSVIQPKLTAGSNVQINNNVISATDTTYTAGSGLALNGTVFSNTAPNVKSDWNAAAGTDAEILNKPFVSTVVYSDWQGDFGYDVKLPTVTLDSDSHKVSGSGYDLGVLPPYPSTTESGNRALMLASQSRVPAWQAVYNKTETDTLLGTKQPTLTPGANVQITNNVISATDTTYTAGAYISISNANVITNTMHLDTSGLMISYNTLGNAGTTNHSFGPFRLELVKSAMVTWDTGNASVYIKFAHSDYLDGSILHGRVLVETYYPWKDGSFTDVWTGHNQWAFDGTYSQGGSNLGFPIYLSSPMDADSNARACPKSMRGYKFTVNCGINSPDWLECTVNPLYLNNNTSLSANGARLLLQVKYFYA